MKMVLATKNRGKLREFNDIFKDLDFAEKISLLSLLDFPDLPDALENGSTFSENALIKARLATKTGYFSIADDSGIIVDALSGSPGINSARYAGPNATDEDNNRKLLSELLDIPEGERKATFISVIVLVTPDGREAVFEGSCDGMILKSPRGEGGFGYDPIFLYPPMGKTFSEMTDIEKNKISHRRRAIEKLAEVLPDFISRR